MDDQDGFTIISKYSREEGIRDGVLIDATPQARETGICLPTAITDHLYYCLQEIPAESVGQDYRGRLHDVLWITHLKLTALSRNPGVPEFPVEIQVWLDGVLTRLWIFVDGDGLTIMFPEDY